MCWYLESVCTAVLVREVEGGDTRGSERHPRGVVFGGKARLGVLVAGGFAADRARFFCLLFFYIPFITMFAFLFSSSVIDF